MKLTKRIAVLAIMIMVCTSFVTMGCAQIKAFLNSTPVTFMCSPTPQQQTTAGAMLAAIDMAQAVGAIYLPGIDVIKASAVLQTIRNGGCFVIAELKAAFEVVDAANLAMSKKAARQLKMAIAPIEEYPDLRVFIKN